MSYASMLHILFKFVYSDGLLLDFPRGKMLISFIDRSFSLAAPTLWNALPISLRKSNIVQQFKSLLKTYLFKLALKNLI